MSKEFSEMVLLDNELVTQKYTKVMMEDDYNYNAPHLFEVRNVETDEIVGVVHFQEGPIKEAGINGVNNEDLVAMVIERLKCFQKSEFACEENAEAIEHFENGLRALRKRTEKREARGVEGTHTV